MTSAPPSSPPFSEKQNPIPVRRRKDLIVQQTGEGSHPVWTVKDPISERFFQLRQADYFVFLNLDGQTSLEEIQQRFFKSHSPRQLSEEQILIFVQRLFSQGLVHVEKFGLADSILERRTRLEANERKQKLSSILAIRFRGIDPDKALERCLPFVNWLFSPVCFVLCLLLSLFAIGIVVAEWESVTREMPRFGTFLKSGEFVWFVVTIGCIKVVHELAHAFACKRFGGECHELGAMLLAFTPCLYCNVSDSWLMKNRWHRIAIAGAGIYVEILMASICVFLWHWSIPGTIHTICLYIMVISSVSTVLLNGNPLLRYDGYYILSDIVGLPNLRSRSQGLVQGWLSQLFFGVRTPDPLRGQPISKTLLGLYGILSGLYIWFVMFAILWMLYQVAKPYGLEAVVIALGMLLLSLRTTGLVGNLLKFMKSLQQQKKFRPFRFGIAAALAIGGLYGLLMLEFPRRLTAPCIVEAHETLPVFISSPGKIEFQKLTPGEVVHEGDLLATLTNRDLERDVLQLEVKVVQQKKKIELLITQQVDNPDAAAEIPSARAKLLNYEDRFKRKQAELERLRLHSPGSGLLLPGEKFIDSKSANDEFQRTGFAIEKINDGAWLEVGTMLCRIADDSAYEAVLYLNQSDAVLLSRKSSASIIVTQSPGTVLTGEIIEIATEPLKVLPPILVRENMIPFAPDGSGQLQPAYPIHEVRVRIIPSEKIKLAIGQTGNATIHLAPESILTTISRMIRQTFTFEL